MPSGSDEIVGVVRLAADPDKERAEFAVMVRSDTKGTGLGYSLMQQIIDYARHNAIKQVFADVLRENHPMLKMVKELGFMVLPTEHQADSVTVVLDL